MMSDQPPTGKHTHNGLIHRRSNQSINQNHTEHAKQSPDGMTVVSAAADETLRFWEIMGQPVGAYKFGS